MTTKFLFPRLNNRSKYLLNSSINFDFWQPPKRLFEQGCTFVKHFFIEFFILFQDNLCLFSEHGKFCGMLLKPWSSQRKNPSKWNMSAFPFSKGLLGRYYGGHGLPLEFGKVPAGPASKAMYAIHVLESFPGSKCVTWPKLRIFTTNFRWPSNPSLNDICLLEACYAKQAESSPPSCQEWNWRKYIYWKII